MEKTQEIIKIKTCWKCPFSNYHYSAGRYDNCNLGAQGNYNPEKHWKRLELPKTTVLKDCPFKNKNIRFELK